MWTIVGWVVWGLCAALTAVQVVAWYGFTRAGRESAFPVGVQAGLWLTLVVAFLVQPWSKLHLLWCFPLAYFGGLFIPMVIVGLRMRGAADAVQRRVHPTIMQREMRRDSEWSAIDGVPCRIIGFAPLASVENGKVVARDSSLPYASVTLQCKRMPGALEGFVTNKVDFANLWAALRERGVSDDEEVIVFWTTKHYRHRFTRLLSRFLPKMWVTICRRGALELMQRMSDPTWEPGSGELEAMAKATSPIVSWKPEVME